MVSSFPLDTMSTQNQNSADDDDGRLGLWCRWIWLDVCQRTLHLSRLAVQELDGIIHHEERHFRLRLEHLPAVLRVAAVWPGRLLQHATELPGRHSLRRWR